MYISRIEINNYRLLQKTSINCEKDLSLIIGKNNCGKTSLLSVLTKCLGKKYEMGKFDFNDFSISFQNKLYDVVTSDSDFDEDSVKGIQVDIFISYDEQDDLSNISSLFLDLDPQNNMVVLRFCYLLKDNVDELRDNFIKYKTTKKGLENRDAFNKFMGKRHKQYFEFKRYSVLYDYKTCQVDNSNFKYLNNKDIDISKIIAFNYVAARRNVSNSDEAELSTLASQYYNKLKELEDDSATSLDMENKLEETDDNFNQLYTAVFKPLTTKISKFGGIKQNETTLKVISQIQTMNLLKNNTTVVYGDQKNYLPENYNGLGFLNLFSIIMSIEIELCDFRKESKKDEAPADINLLFIEEPEAHTHPQMQYIFIKNIKDLLEEGRVIGDSDKKINLQTFMTTHSSHIVAESDFDDIKYFVKDEINHNILSKNLKDLETLYQNEKGEGNNHFKFLKQYLTLNRAEIFFADKVILIEGDTERILLPAIIKKLDQEHKYEIPLLSQNVSIIEVGNYSEIYAEFIHFMGIKTLIITDIDTCYYSDASTQDNKKCLCKCCVEEGTHTSNAALKYYLKQKLGNHPEQAKEILTGLTFDEKIIVGEKDDKGNLQWQSDKCGNVLVVYQTKETNRNNSEYNARSFEDAFFHLNRNLFQDLGGENKQDNINLCEGQFQSLKNHDMLFDDNIGSYELAQKCVNKKPSLAMDILLNSRSEGRKDFANWEIPSYIKEGLEWLQQN